MSDFRVEAQDRRQDLFAGVGYGVLAALIWGAWPVVSRLGVEQTLSPYDVAALRFGVAGLLLLPLVLRRGVAGVGWPGAILLACGAGVPYVLVAVGGLTYAPAGHSGVIIPSCMMVFATIGGWWVLRDRPERARLAGLAIIIAGVVMTGWGSLAGGGSDSWIGDLAFVAAGALWATYTVAARALKADPFHATALVSVLSMIGFVPAYLIFGEPRIFSAPLSEVLFQAVFQGVFAAILALLFYTRSVAILGASRGAVFAALVPGVAVLLSAPVLGEAPSLLEFGGLLVVTFGMACALRLVRLEL